MEPRGLALVLTVLAASFCLAQPKDQKRPWKGYAILGNGHLTAVYSDDSRVESLTHAKGIQHFYFKDYAADYVASTSFELTGTPRAGMKNFFTAQTTTPLADIRCFVHPDDAVVLSLRATGAGAANPYRFEAQLREEIKTDVSVNLTSLKTARGVAVAIWSNGTVLVIAPKNSSDNVTVSGSSVVVTGGSSPKPEILMTSGFFGSRSSLQGTSSPARSRSRSHGWQILGVLDE